MRPDYDRLAEAFRDDNYIQIADVDCTVEEEVCAK